jgi:sulfite exporter TauE/SafE
MTDAITRGVMLGLSTGAVCLGFCAPILAPLMMAEERLSLRERARPLILFLFGRLIAYLLCGALAGWLGSRFLGLFSPAVSGTLYLLTALLLVSYGLQIGLPEWKICRWLTNSVPARRTSFGLGFLLGLNLCPPFVAALTDVFVAGRVLYGLLFFFTLYLMTSLFLMPLFFLGQFSIREPVRVIGRMAMIITAVLYFFLGLQRLI